jgi:hypothetical protein
LSAVLFLILLPNNPQIFLFVNIIIKLTTKRQKIKANVFYIYVR